MTLLRDSMLVSDLKKGEPVVKITIVVAIRFMSPLIYWFCVLILGTIRGDLRKQIANCTNVRYALLIAPCALCWSFGDLFEMMANGGLDPTMYVILSQARLLLTAVFAVPLMGRGQTTLQWVMLTSLTMILCVYSLIDGGQGSEENTLTGVLMVAGKISCSVFGGLWGEKMLKGIDVSYISLQHFKVLPTPWGARLGHERPGIVFDAPEYFDIGTGPAP